MEASRRRFARSLGQLSLTRPPRSCRCNRCHPAAELLCHVFPLHCSAYTKHYSLRCWEGTKHGCRAALRWDPDSTWLWDLLKVTVKCGCQLLPRAVGKDWMKRPGQRPLSSAWDSTSVTCSLWVSIAGYFQYSVIHHDTVRPIQRSKSAEDFSYSYCFFFKCHIPFEY